MNSARKSNVSAKPVHRAPAPADYCDEVTEEQMNALRELIKDELKGEQPEIVKGPAW